MPQLVPFYFLNQVSFAFLLLMVLLYVVSKFILPNFKLVQSSRMFLASK
uniref:ATP synthase protein 8 n=1 Tax=Rhizopus oryzae TaxID=64495 RepID=Q3T4D7_RHIOR|nr:ATP synthase F0 subunit 8 [Rhizopus arrhizus]AAW49468.1 ATP synthase F0 subunit 8 [Rhizopus arrhizus]